MALFHGSSAVIGVRLNKNPAELAAAKIVPNPEDARSKLAKITPKGGELLMQAYAKSSQDAATMDPPLLIEQMEQCLEPLAQIRAQLDAARDKTG